MVSKDVVMDTIKRMKGSGIDEQTIRTTLKESGISDEEIEAYLNEGKGSAPVEQAKASIGGKPLESSDAPLEQKEEETKEVNPEHEKIAQKTAEKVKEHLDESVSTQELHNSTVQTELEEHKQRIEDVHKNVDALHTKVDINPGMPMQTVSQINIIEKRLNQIGKELGEIRANTNALSSLLKKIIETNREILNNLKK